MKFLYSLLLITFFACQCIFGQTKWTSRKYKYTIEIPDGFTQSKPIGKNVDFKAINVDGFASIVVSVHEFTPDATDIDWFEIITDLDAYYAESKKNMLEYVDDFDIVKYGTTTIDGLNSVWSDSVFRDKGLYVKGYQVKKNNYLYTFELTSSISRKDYWNAYWFRFKNSIRL